MCSQGARLHDGATTVLSAPGTPLHDAAIETAPKEAGEGEGERDVQAVDLEYTGFPDKPVYIGDMWEMNTLAERRGKSFIHSFIHSVLPSCTIHSIHAYVG